MEESMQAEELQDFVDKDKILGYFIRLIKYHYNINITKKEASIFLFEGGTFGELKKRLHPQVKNIQDLCVLFTLFINSAVSFSGDYAFNFSTSPFVCWFLARLVIEIDENTKIRDLLEAAILRQNQVTKEEYGEYCFNLLKALKCGKYDCRRITKEKNGNIRIAISVDKNGVHREIEKLLLNGVVLQMAFLTKGTIDNKTIEKANYIILFRQGKYEQKL